MECVAQQLPTFSGPHCVVEFSFNNAEDFSELNQNKGDVVELVERVGGDWLRLARKEGIISAHFVTVIEDLPPAPTLRPNMTTAAADFDGMEGELSFKVRGACKLPSYHFPQNSSCVNVSMYICTYVCTCRLVSTSL